MTRYDAESLLKDVKAILVNNLNTKVAAIEAEKIAVGCGASGITAIDTAKGYFEQTWSDKILNINPAIFYGIEDIAAEGMGPWTSETIQIFVEVILVDSGIDPLQLARNKILRYSRAIKEVFQENYDRLPMGNQIKIKTLRPIAFKLDLNTSEEIKVGGVSITTALA